VAKATKAARAKSPSRKVDLRNYELLDNGCIVVRRHFDNLLEPYKKEPIPNYLGLVDHKQAIEDQAEYERMLRKEEKELNLQVRKLKQAGKSLVIVFQGRDGAGKSGATERIIEALDYDMSIFDAIHVGPPTQDELAHPYLWRFMQCQRMPEYGQVRVFDRSWAERLLVEPVMGITKGEAIRKSYAEIRAFEWLLCDVDTILVKFWLDITKKEQAMRFEKRAKKKPWKVTDSDSIARKKWDAYTHAANEMFHRTSTPSAPWYILASEDKAYSRVMVLNTINQTLRDALH
jgi:AMP-polyphosphate phosphotransferase